MELIESIFGPNSPCNVLCGDRKISYDDFYKEGTEENKYIQMLINKDLNIKKKNKDMLSEIDKKLDIPRIRVILETNMCEKLHLALETDSMYLFNKEKINLKCCEESVIKGYVSNLQYLEKIFDKEKLYHHFYGKFSHIACKLAIEYNQLECLKFLHKKGFHMDVDFISYAKSLEIFEYIMSIISHRDSKTKYRHKFISDNVEYLKYVISNNLMDLRHIISSLIIKGFTDCLQYLLDIDILNSKNINIDDNISLYVYIHTYRGSYYVDENGDEIITLDNQIKKSIKYLLKNDLIWQDVEKCTDYNYNFDKYYEEYDNEKNLDL